MDLSVDEEQAAIAELFAAFCEKECPPDRVRAAEALGFDRELWARFADTGAPAMGLREDQGGSEARLLDAALVAEALGGALAPLPFVEHFVATRLLARGGAANDEHAVARIATLALQPARR